MLHIMILFAQNIFFPVKCFICLFVYIIINLHRTFFGQWRYI